MEREHAKWLRLIAAEQHIAAEQLIAAEQRIAAHADTVANTRIRIRGLKCVENTVSMPWRNLC